MSYQEQGNGLESKDSARTLDLMKHVVPEAEAPVVQNEVDPVAEYLSEVKAISGEAPEGYVDPHAEESSAREARKGPDNDVDPHFSDGPSERDLEDGEEVDPDADVNGARGLPEDEDDEIPAGQEEQPETNAPDKVESGIKPLDEIEATALLLRERKPDLSLEKALEAARQIHKDEVDEAKEEDIPEVPAVKDLKAELRELSRKHRKAVEDFEDDDVLAEINDRMDEIEDVLIPEAEKAEAARREQEAQAAAAEQERVNAEYQKYADQALSLYPDAGKEGSPLYRRMEEIHADLERNDDPLVDSPTKSLKIAQMAAAELAIAPKRAGSPPPSKSRARSQAPMTAPIGSPSRGTIAPRQSRVEDAIGAIQTPEDFEAYIGAV